MVIRILSGQSSRAIPFKPDSSGSVSVIDFSSDAPLCQASSVREVRAVFRRGFRPEDHPKCRECAEMYARLAKRYGKG